MIPSSADWPVPWRSFFFFHDPATTDIYTLSLHDALPICLFVEGAVEDLQAERQAVLVEAGRHGNAKIGRAQSELQSLRHLVCRLLLEKKKPSTLTDTTTLALHRYSPITTTPSKLP